MSFDRLIKLSLLGSAFVGKSSLITKFVDNTFIMSTTTTIGVDFRAKDVDVDGKIIRLEIWDTAGQETFRSGLGNAIFHEKEGFILVFDLTEEDTLKEINNFLVLINQNCPPNVLIVLVGNKCDLENQFENLEEKIKEILPNNEFKLFKTSAKDGTNVNELFEYIAKTLKENQPKSKNEYLLKNEKNLARNGFVNILEPVPKIKKSKCC
ncbi:ras-related protein rab-35 [Anaeramoeba ignava]|uniref:Ras-related protein rab-35 n=1 Tax=Anaeramoeba ignava TaxID=1746090 RepID=A0A9Q0LPZ5_ANAIG|nr:ras-related protein rab-35 [Anaeramoeba ignava]